MAATDMSERELATDETVSLISADKVEGTPVYGADRDKIGTVQKLMIDKRSGRVSYAVLSVGGFLGLGDRHHPLPWGALSYDTDLDGYLVNVTRETVEQGPSYEEGTEPAWHDAEWRGGVNEHYGRMGAAPIV